MDTSRIMIAVFGPRSPLAALSARPGVVFSRRQLLDAVWTESWVGNEHLVDVHIGHLRRKLGDDPAAPRYLGRVHGGNNSSGSFTQTKGMPC